MDTSVASQQAASCASLPLIISIGFNIVLTILSIVGLWIQNKAASAARQSASAAKESAGSAADAVRIHRYEVAKKFGPKISVEMTETPDLRVFLSKNIRFGNSEPVGARLISYEACGFRLTPDNYPCEVPPSYPNRPSFERTLWELPSDGSHLLDRCIALLQERDELVLRFVFQGASGQQYEVVQIARKGQDGKWKGSPIQDFVPII